MAKKKAQPKLPEGDRPITNYSIVDTRFTPTFETADGFIKGQFSEVLAAVGVRLELPQGEAPYLVPGQPIIGRYATGTAFKINKASLFTNTSKMPGVSFAIPAGPPAFGGTCPASALGEDVAKSRQILTTQTGKPLRRLPVLQDADSSGQSSKLMPGVASSYAGDASFTCRSCYALSGNYRYPSKQVNDMMHLAWCEYELAQGGPERLGHALAYAIQHVNITRSEGFQPYFRIHDAGDFHRPDYLEAWAVCAALMTHMRFWAPTRQWIFKKWAPLLAAAEKRARDAGGWLVIRPSVLRFYESVPIVEGISAGSGVSSEEADPCIWVCPVYNKVVPKPQPDGTVVMGEAKTCLEANCTMCWDQPGVPVSYGAH